MRYKTVLVTGGAGYIGSILIRQLLEKGYRIITIDKMLHDTDSLDELKSNPNFRFIKGDILNEKDINKAVKGSDAVVHLAAIVGDAACAVRKDVTIETNYLGTMNLANLCKSNNIKRLIFISTCSVYGAGESGKLLKETSRLNPVSFYAETKQWAEAALLKLTDENFSPVILRLGTIYGLSPRMRFDLVVNYLSQKSVRDKKILIFGGKQWRPFIQVADICRAIIACLEADESKVKGQIFNVGSTKENYTLTKVGEFVKKCVPGTRVEHINKIQDERTYDVDFSKIHSVLGFNTEKSVKDGIIEISNAVKEGKYENPDDRKYYNA